MFLREFTTASAMNVSFAQTYTESANITIHRKNVFDNIQSKENMEHPQTIDIYRYFYFSMEHPYINKQLLKTMGIWPYFFKNLIFFIS